MKNINDILAELDNAVAELDTPIKGDETSVSTHSASRYWKSAIEGVHVSVYVSVRREARG